MNCQKLETIIIDLARERMLGSAVRDSAIAHCRACSSCGKKLADQQALTGTLRRFAGSMGSIEAPAIVEKNILAAFGVGQVTTRSRFTASQWAYSASAVAAMLLIVLGIAAAMRFYQPVRTSSNKGHESPLPANVESSSSLPTASVKSPQQPDRGISFSRRFKPRLRSAKTDRIPKPALEQKVTNTTAGEYATEIATEFLPLGYGNSLNLQDGGQIVRVEVPRSTLASFGLPVNTNRVSERVKADLLLGADGSARAIRFVQ